MTRERIITISTILLILLILPILAACSSQPQAANNARIKATWIKPVITGDSVSIPVSEVDKYTITHFKVSSPTGELAFMAYKFDGKLYARANICPPCLSESFSLKKDTLVCDTCGTVFDARTGAGISGPCVAFPKAAVTYGVKDGNIMMKGTDLVTAFQNTLNPKKS